MFPPALTPNRVNCNGPRIAPVSRDKTKALRWLREQDSNLNRLNCNRSFARRRPGQEGAIAAQ
jgi:hypothetical protein